MKPNLWYFEGEHLWYPRRMHTSSEPEEDWIASLRVLEHQLYLTRHGRASHDDMFLGQAKCSKRNIIGK